MGNKYYRYIFFVLLCFLCFFPQKTLAAEKEYDFNKNSSITIAEKNSYAATKQYTWLKYQPSADGYLTVQVSDPEGASSHAKGYMALYNSTKSTILSSKSIFYNTANTNNAYWYEFTFGLQKDQVYYIRVKGDNGVKLSRTFKKVNDKSGVSKEKAKNLKKNVSRTGLIPAGVTNTDWYKVKLTKKQKLRLYYNVKTSGSFKITVYSNTQAIGTLNVSYTSGQRKVTLYQYLKTSKKKTGLNSGVYYIKIERANTASSGYYNIMWN